MELKGKHVLVTGGDGFIGSHLVEMLLKEGCKVRALTQYNSFNSWGWLDHFSNNENDNLEIVSGDIRDLAFCYDLLRDIEIVFHLAALIAIPFSYKSPGSYIDVNITGTSNICQAAKHHKVNKILHTSTSEVYGTAIYAPIDEKHPLQPQSPYSASKIGADAIARSYHNSFDLPLVVVRPFNTYGPRQSARAVIPTIISQIAKGNKSIKLGDLTPTRDFTFVKDTCLGFMSIAKTENLEGEVINIGTNREISIGNLVSLIANLMNFEINILEDQVRKRPTNSEVHRLLSDNTKIKQLTDFKLKFTLDEGLKETIKWFTKEENLKLYKTNIYNV